MTFDQILKIVMIIGIPAIVGSCIYVGKKLEMLNILQDTTNKVKYNIKVIANCLIKAPFRFDNDKLKDYSPIQLTDKGRKYLNDISFIKIFEDNKKDFFDYIDTDKPTTKYDVETHAMKSFLILFEKNYFKPIKEFLYTHPKDNLQEVDKIAGIYIRDSYLEKHPEITK